MNMFRTCLAAFAALHLTIGAAQALSIAPISYPFEPKPTYGSDPVFGLDETAQGRSGGFVVLMMKRRGEQTAAPTSRPLYPLPKMGVRPAYAQEWAYPPPLRLAAEQVEQQARLIKKHEPTGHEFWQCILGTYDPWSDPSVPKFWEMGFLDTYSMPKKSANTAYQVLYEAVERQDGVSLYFTGREGLIRTSPPYWPVREHEIYWRPY